MGPDEPERADDPAEAVAPADDNAADKADEPAIKKTFVSVSGALAGAATFIVTIRGAVNLVVPSWRPLSRDKIQASLTVPSIESRPQHERMGAPSVRGQSRAGR